MNIVHFITYCLARRRVLIGLCSALFCILLSYFFLFSILMPRYKQFNNVMLLDTAAALLLLWGLISFFRSNLAERIAQALGRKRVLIPVFALLFVIQLCLAVSLSIDPSKSGWDPLTLFQSTMNLVTPQRLFPDVSGYFQAFPNNLGILGLLAGWLNLFGHFGIHNYFGLTLLLNLFFLNAGLILTYLSVRRIATKKASLFALLLGFVFITFSLWSRTFYSDTVGLFFPIASFYLLIRLRQTKNDRMRIVLALVLGCVAGAGYLIKPTTIFVLVAAALVYGLQIAHPLQKTQRALYSLAIVACIFGGFLAVSTSVKSVMIHKMDLLVASMPPTNFMLMGLTRICTPEECRYGAWNMPDALKQGQFQTMDSYKQYTISEIKHRLKDYGVGEYALFLSEKGAWVVGDGSFYAYHEGTDKTAPFLHTNHFNQEVQKFMHPSGAYYVYFENFIQIVWIVLLACIVLPFFILKQRRRVTNYIYITEIALLGLLAFLLLFEARSRYLYLYVPMFIVLASYNFDALLQTPLTKPLRRSLALMGHPTRKDTDT